MWCVQICLYARDAVGVFLVCDIAGNQKESMYKRSNIRSLFRTLHTVEVVPVKPIVLEHLRVLYEHLSKYFALTI